MKKIALTITLQVKKIALTITRMYMDWFYSRPLIIFLLKGETLWI
ncbi:hypothetical protein PP914_gp076 [Arthrobacter phage Qui]|uniref:Uncharacterized protein n=1 Tax=Arthrobacter phage Qui TaxID=2603260 RepID=A0A5B8WK25_9CAUD|nr:hypothetical protein PP914_gp076 [Arthrobacter phage Qui]QED11566.1 hypothetical protein SEA_QUI_76 [Arthrobacter phage Qui]QOC56398.1 hypothetical protein SEA_PAELLA_76 [Arthrobacter phage Paella]